MAMVSRGSVAMKPVMAARVSSAASRCGRMAGAGDQLGLDRRLHVGFQDPELLVGAVGIVGALQRQDRHLDVRQEAGDVEVAEPGVEPGVVPALERGVDVAMISSEARPEGRRFRIPS